MPDTTTTSRADRPASASTGERQRSSAAGTAWLLTGLVALVGVVLTTTLSVLGAFNDTPLKPGLFGGHPAGWAGAWPRLIDDLSYFTIWSNIVVAITMLTLARQARRTPSLNGAALPFWLRVLITDSLLMITVTGIVYAVLLAPAASPTGWGIITNALLHYITPPLTVLVWLVFGPRGAVTARPVAAAMVLPIIWIVWTFARGAVIKQYPYGFLNVPELGLMAVSVVLAVILGFAVLLGVLFLWVDRLLARRRG